MREQERVEGFNDFTHSAPSCSLRELGSPSNLSVNMAFVVLRSRTMSSLLPFVARRSITSLTHSSIHELPRNITCRLNTSKTIQKQTMVLVRSFGIWGPDKTPLDMSMVESRVMKICGSYDKIDASSVFKIQRRTFSHLPPITYDFIVERVILVMEMYEKIDKSKLKLDSHFANDLGLDSLDHVEVIMAIEDEFSFEIPDKDAEKLWTPADIIKYVADKEEAWRELQH